LSKKEEINLKFLVLKSVFCAKIAT